MIITHKWKKLATTLSNMLLHRRCRACGLMHRRMRYGLAESRRGWTRDEYRWRVGEKWTNKYDMPPCTAVRVCPTCAGRGTVAEETNADHEHVVVFENDDSDYDLPDFTGPFASEEAAVAWAKKTYPPSGGKTNWYVAPLNPDSANEEAET